MMKHEYTEKDNIHKEMHLLRSWKTYCLFYLQASFIQTATWTFSR